MLNEGEVWFVQCVQHVLLAFPFSHCQIDKSQCLPSVHQAQKKEKKKLRETGSKWKDGEDK